ncbi:MAG: alpha/beta fold hydrolase [Sphingosinicella sp.]
MFLAMLHAESAAHPRQMARALEGLRRYQEAKRPRPRRPMPAIAQADGATLRDYGGTGAPLLFVPSLINPPSILDLRRDKSLLRWLARSGHRVLLLDWGWPDEARHKLSVGGHVERILLPLLDALGERAHLAGYCLGGTMAAAAAQLRPVRSLAMIATPWHFEGFEPEARERLAGLWSASQYSASQLGVLPMEVLQTAFWSLDPQRTIAKFVAFADMDEKEARTFVTLEDWANDGPPLAFAAARELFEDFFAADRPGRGQWRVGGTIIDPGKLDIPMLSIVSTSDRIVPAASAVRAGERLELAQGHVGMVVGRQAREKLWRPLDAWLKKN